jgi:hypothetical protein
MARGSKGTGTSFFEISTKTQQADGNDLFVPLDCVSSSESTWVPRGASSALTPANSGGGTRSVVSSAQSAKKKGFIKR